MIGIKFKKCNGELAEAISEPFVQPDRNNELCGHIMIKNLIDNTIECLDMCDMHKVFTDSEYEAWNKS